MKKLYLAGKAVLGLALVLSVSSCATGGTKSTKEALQTDEVAPRFMDEKSVNAVLQFSSWEYTFLIKPQYSESGYLQQVHREDLGTICDKLNVTRGTAVVVVGWTYNGDVLKKVVSDWKTVLSGAGFQRVVVLRAQWGKKLNGSVIVDDSILHIGSVQTASRGS